MSQDHNWANDSSLSLSLSLWYCGWSEWSSPMLRCSVSCCGVWQKSVIFQNIGRCPQLALVYFFCHFKAPMDSLLLFHTRVRFRMLCFILDNWIGSLLKLYKKKKIPLSKPIAVILLVIVKVVLHNNPPISCLPHTSHEGFQRLVQVNLFFFIFCIFFIILYYITVL